MCSGLFADSSIRGRMFSNYIQPTTVGNYWKEVLEKKQLPPPSQKVGKRASRNLIR